MGSGPGRRPGPYPPMAPDHGARRTHPGNRPREPTQGTDPGNRPREPTQGTHPRDPPREPTEDPKSGEGREPGASGGRRRGRHRRRTDVIEPDVIEPEPAAAAPRWGRRRQAVLAGLTLLAVVAGGL